MTFVNNRHTPFFDPEDALTSGELAFIQDLSDSAGDDALNIPIISTGSGAPGTTPANEGDIYVDTSGGNAYIATGTSSSSDWEQIDGAAGSITVAELDGTPSVSATTIKFPNGTVTDNGDGSATYTPAGSGGDVTAASTFGTDNVLIRSDGTGKGVQSSGITISDTTNDVAGVGSLKIVEAAAAIADTAGSGQIWVKNDTPNVIMFTDDAGTDFQLATLTGTETLTNKTIDADNNTISNLAVGAEVSTDFGGNAITNLGDITFRTGATGGTLRTGTSAADKFVLQAYDVDGTAYQTVLELDAANTPVLQLRADFLEIDDETDTSKRVTWDVSGATTSTATDLAFAQTANRTITFPDVTGTLLTSLAEDTTPQLGGSLDVNGNKIVSTSNGNIDIEPNGTGNVLLGNFTFDADQTVGAGQDNYVLTYDNGTGLISLEAAGAGSGDVSKVGTPVNNQIGVWTGDGTIEGDADLTWDATTNTLDVGAVAGDAEVEIVNTSAGDNTYPLIIRNNSGTPNTSVGINFAATTGSGPIGFIRMDRTDGMEIGASISTPHLVIDTSGNATLNESTSLSFGANAILADSAGTMTLSNIDALDATTEATIEAAIDTLSNLTTVGTLTSGNADAIVSAASTTTAGKVELATTAETDTGTDTGRAVTPDGLAGSYAGTKSVGVQVTDGSGAITTGDGKAYFRVPASLNGMNITAVAASLTAPSTSGTPTVQIARGRQAAAGTAHAFVDVLSTAITIDANEYDSKDATTAAVINTSNDDVATGDLIRIDVDGVGSGPTAVLSVNVEFQLP